MDESTSDTRDKNRLSIVVRKKADLYASYMPFIEDGAFFVRTTQSYRLHDEVSLTLDFADEGSKLSCQTRVVWITPRGAQGGRVSGVGLKIIDEDSSEIVKKVETILAGTEKSDNPTDTL